MRSVSLILSQFQKEASNQEKKDKRNNNNNSNSNNKMVASSSSTIALLAIIALVVLTSSNVIDAAAPPIPDPDTVYYMPSEEEPHEGTWIQWPHNFGWDPRHVARLQGSFVAMTKALHTGERVHIVVYNPNQRRNVANLLRRNGVNLNRIDFLVWRTDDVWARDNGPIFAYDQNDNLVVQDWRFNGWGNKADYFYDDAIPRKVASVVDLPLVRVPMVNEGGSVEVDGHGTLMAKRSSILNRNRNPGWTQADVEAYFAKYLGVTNFIWLEGKKDLDITDDHIDATARFAKDGKAIVTYYEKDFVDAQEYRVLKNARNANGQPYEMVHLPLTSRVIPSIGDYGYYINYYVGNEVVLVPTFNDPNDGVAQQTLGKVYPGRRIVGINFTELFKDGGLVHCVTQQEPLFVRR